jgi:hypothetical protein
VRLRLSRVLTTLDRDFNDTRIVASEPRRLRRRAPPPRPSPRRLRSRPKAFGQILTEAKFLSAGLAPASAGVCALPQGRIASD